eukprot:TRINITY_DN1961_c0_g1_i2.p1 TRINITY_DN1961_c0_g1~~TRINITY_DN1961_c0_g1_i2.p1  ORF type:complete len:561 (-),score=78.64 TRINITY_DN1961_c0_g1_i2:485-2167(-)
MRDRFTTLLVWNRPIAVIYAAVVILFVVSEAVATAAIVLSLSRTQANLINSTNTQRGVPTIPLQGNLKLAEYYFNIKIGTPGKLFSVQLDTGSSATALPLNTCRHSEKKIPCHSFHARYAPLLSSTAKVLPCFRDCSSCISGNCGFRLSYGDGSKVDGYVMEDVVAIGGVSFPFTFGAISSITGEFEHGPVDGISGFALYPSAPSTMESFFRAFANKANLAMVFSVCMGWEGGYITFGGHSPTIAEQDLKYVPIVSDHYYSINIHSLSFSEHKLELATQDFISMMEPPVIDSGTSLMIFPEVVFTKIKAYLQTHYCHVGGICPDGDGKSMFEGFYYKIPSSQKNTLPTMKFALDSNIILELTHDYYLSNIDGYVGLGFTKGSSIPTILGNTFMRAFAVVFDLEKRRIGFTKSKDCNGMSHEVQLLSKGTPTVSNRVHLSQPTKVKVVATETKEPIGGVEVLFSVQQGRDYGYFNPERTITSQNGEASSFFVMGSIPGRINLTVTAIGVPSSLASFSVETINETGVHPIKFASVIFLACFAALIVRLLGRLKKRLTVRYVV